MTRVVDTSVIYALFNVADAHHKKAKVAFESSELIVLPREIVTESVDLIQLRMGFRVAASSLAALLGMPHVRLAEPAHIDAVVRRYAESGGRLSLADSVVVETARSRAAMALSFDREILKAVD